MPDLAASPHRATLPNCDGCGQFTSTPTVVDNSWHGGAGMYMCGELLLCPRCAAKRAEDELLGTTDRSRRPTTSPGFRESMRAALEAAAPLIAAKAWDEGYAEGGRGRMWDSTNPYCWAEP